MMVGCGLAGNSWPLGPVPGMSAYWGAAEIKCGRGAVLDRSI
jgi:hypothetical protein